MSGGSPASLNLNCTFENKLRRPGKRHVPKVVVALFKADLKFVPTAILSRQVAVIRKHALIINLPGQPKSIRETLEGLKDAGVHGIFAAVPYCIDLIGGPYIETHESVVKAFRPKSALRKPT